MNAVPHIKTYQPTDPQLQSRIPYYYFLSKEDQKSGFSFWYYPHYNSALLILKNGEIILDGNTEYITPNLSKELTYILYPPTTIPKKVTVTEPCDLLGIAFKPLGMNCFISKPFEEKQRSHISTILAKDLTHQIIPIFESEDISLKGAMLDKLFSEIMNDFQAPTLGRAVSEIINLNGSVDLQDLSNSFQINRRTLSRYFKQHLGITFRDFKALVKFRVALNQGVQGQIKDNMNNLALEANYYDQSDFIKHFKIKTNETPKHMLKSVSKVTDELIWKMI